MRNYQKDSDAMNILVCELPCSEKISTILAAVKQNFVTVLMNSAFVVINRDCFCTNFMQLDGTMLRTIEFDD